MKLGFVGLGAMGLPMTRNLVAAGHQVTVASRSRPPVDEAMAFGAIDGGTLTDVATSSEVLILCVPNSPEVVQVLDAVLPALGPGTIVVDCSTIDPDVERAQHARVTRHRRPVPRRAGVGGTVGAKKGTLTLMVGGDAATLEDARPALDPMAGLIVHVGGPGMGQVVKLCNNLIYAAQMVATAEATALAMRSGVDMAKLLEVLLHSTGDCTAVRTRLPVAGRHRRQPRLERVATRLHDRPHGQGPRPRPVLRGARRCAHDDHGHRPPGAHRGVDGGVRARGLLGSGEGGAPPGRRADVAGAE